MIRKTLVAVGTAVVLMVLVSLCGGPPKDPPEQVARAEPAAAPPSTWCRRWNAFESNQRAEGYTVTAKVLSELPFSNPLLFDQDCLDDHAAELAGGFLDEWCAAHEDAALEAFVQALVDQGKRLCAAGKEHPPPKPLDLDGLEN